MIELLTIPENLPFFDGHFPGNPVLPGILVIELSCTFLKKIDPGLATQRLTTVLNAKFSKAVTAGMKVVLQAEKRSDNWTVSWREEGKEAEIAVLSLAFGGPG